MIGEAGADAWISDGRDWVYLLPSLRPSQSTPEASHGPTHGIAGLAPEENLDMEDG
jgi:hypothetical protein